MKTIHDEEKIKELLTNDSAWSDNMREYAEHIARQVRLKTIDEAIGCVPKEKIIIEDEPNMFTPEDETISLEHAFGFNSCRHKFITNLEQLKK